MVINRLQASQARTRRVVAVHLMLAVLLGFPLTALAANETTDSAASAPSTATAERTRAVGARERSDALAHWTPARMGRAERAMPALREDARATRGGQVENIDKGPVTELPPAAPSPAAKLQAEATTAGVASDSSTVVRTAAAPAALAASEGYFQGASTASPNAQIGRLFYQQYDPAARVWKDYTCSGAVVNSPSRSLVWTAGHCVYQTYSNLWNRNYVFCPGYRSGSCPLGRWTPTLQHTTTQWQGSVCNVQLRCTFNEFQYDLGALRMSPINGTAIGNWVGYHGIQFNGAVYQSRYLYGYPGNKSNGEYLYYCSGTNTYSAPNLYLACSAGPGASGGPWLSSINSSGLGVVHSVNSHLGTASMGGPYQGSVALELYNRSKN